AAAWAVGRRSGGRGGPLVIEAAEVSHVLMAPVDRGNALRPPAVRQLRFGALVGAGVGAVGGLLAFRRLPGGFPAWVACGAALGALAVLGGLGLALVVSGMRLGRWWGGGLALVVAAWSGADVALRTTTSPATLLGDVAMWPLRWRAAGVAGVAVPLAAAATGLALVGGCGIEAAERRAALVGQIRFAATLRDLRTVVVLRRQLSQELPRQRPVVRLPRSIPAEWVLPRPNGAREPRARRRRFPVWRRGWHGILRFPNLRFLRLAILGAIAGAAMVGAWRGVTPLVIVAGLALYVAALDAVEPLAQDIDHPDRLGGYPAEAGVLLLRHAGPPVVLMVLVSAVGLGAAVALDGSPALSVGAVIVVPAALAAVAGAAMSVIQGPPPTFSSADTLMPPEAAGARAVTRTLLPPLIATAGVLPVLAGRHPRTGVTPAAAVTALTPLVVILVAAVGLWVRYRERAKVWFKEAMEEASATRRGVSP
ncbi:MAG: hypothetical protein ACR2KC_01125, partial [Acidimicrobiales bacterium]